MVQTLSSITVTLECYGELKQLCGGATRQLELHSNHPTANDAVQALVSQHPQAASAIERSVFAVGDSLITSDHLLNDGDVLALIPPVSGG